MMSKKQELTHSERLDILEKKLRTTANDYGRTKLVVHEIGGSMSWIGYERRKKKRFNGFLICYILQFMMDVSESSCMK